MLVAGEAVASTSFFGIYLSACPSAVNTKDNGIRIVSVLVMAKTRATFLVHEMAKPPSKLPRGMADHASTLAMLITRPSIWLGTIACRRLLVLMLKRMPNPPAIIQRNAAIQNQRICETDSSSSPDSISTPNATLLNDQCLRRGPAGTPLITTPRLP